MFTRMLLLLVLIGATTSLKDNQQENTQNYNYDLVTAANEGNIPWAEALLEIGADPSANEYLALKVVGATKNPQLFALLLSPCKSKLSHQYQFMRYSAVVGDMYIVRKYSKSVAWYHNIGAMLETASLFGQEKTIDFIMYNFSGKMKLLNIYAAANNAERYGHAVSKKLRKYLLDENPLPFKTDDSDQILHKQKRSQW